MAFNTYDDGARNPKSKSVKLVEQNNKSKYDPKTHGYKKILCPVHMTSGFLHLFREHMYNKHFDYIKKHNITPLIFEFLEELGSYDYLSRDKFVWYQWPETNVRIYDVNLNKINSEDYRAILFMFKKIFIFERSQTYTSISDIIKHMKYLRPHLEQPEIVKFIEKCVDEGILSTGKMYYDFNESKYMELGYPALS